MANPHRWLPDVTPKLLFLVLGLWMWAGSPAAAEEKPAAAAPATAPADQQAAPAPSSRTLLGFAIFKIDPRTPLAELLPVAPILAKAAGPLLNDKLDQVPEISFAKARKGNEDGIEHDWMSYTMARIRHLNDKKTDGYMAALLDRRPDLSGLSFVLGAACRQQKEESHLFAQAVRKVRASLNQGEFFRDSAASGIDAKLFWSRFREACKEEDEQPAGADLKPARARARIAALMQILAIEPAGTRSGLVKYLGEITQLEATRALTRLALFAPEESVRAAAVATLKGRGEEAGDLLLAGFRYPMPVVAQRAGQAVAKLQRADLAPRLVDLLEAPDPRAPTTEVIQGRKNHVVREVVRVNHHRNCVMCHVPGNLTDITVAPVPLPTQPLDGGGYGSSSFDVLARSDIMIRIDVTYLRQDFSALMPVDNAQPWPQQQRFDFLVRQRTLTDKEAAAYRDKLTSPDKASPYLQAIVTALRELTGQEASTPEGWRRILDLPKKSS